MQVRLEADATRSDLYEARQKIDAALAAMEANDSDVHEKYAESLKPKGRQERSVEYSGLGRIGQTTKSEVGYGSQAGQAIPRPDYYLTPDMIVRFTEVRIAAENLIRIIGIKCPIPCAANPRSLQAQADVRSALLNAYASICLSDIL